MRGPAFRAEAGAGGSPRSTDAAHVRGPCSHGRKLPLTMQLAVLGQGPLSLVPRAVPRRRAWVPQSVSIAEGHLALVSPAAVRTGMQMPAFRLRVHTWEWDFWVTGGSVVSFVTQRHLCF